MYSTHGEATVELASARLATMLEKRMLNETLKCEFGSFKLVCHRHLQAPAHFPPYITFDGYSR
jgi:hypothetical protein